MKFLRNILMGIGVLYAFSSNAAPTVIDFNSGCTINSATYSEDGYDLTARGYNGTGTNGFICPYVTAGAADLYNSPGSVDVVAANGSRFNAISLDIAGEYGSSGNPITITGYLFGGGTTTQAFSTTAGWSTLALNSSFVDLIKLNFQSYFNEFDNITLNEVPLPAALPLLLAALGGMGLVARRRKSV